MKFKRNLVLFLDGRVILKYNVFCLKVRPLLLNFSCNFNKAKNILKFNLEKNCK